MDFGSTNDLAKLEAARAFRDAAVADGWTIAERFPGREPIESASELEREGFVMAIITRSLENRKWKAEVGIDIWGPDGLCIEPPSVYDWTAIVAGVRRCDSCGKTDVDTQRYSFAGRCCAECLPAMRAEHEKPGWCN